MHSHSVHRIQALEMPSDVSAVEFSAYRDPWALAERGLIDFDDDTQFATVKTDYQENILRFRYGQQFWAY